MFSSILSNLVSYLENCYLNAVTEIPSVALLTGINMPDHAAQFTTLGEQIKKNISPHVVVLYSDDCPNIKTLMENMINQILSVVDSNLESVSYLQKIIFMFTFQKYTFRTIPMGKSK